MPEKQDDFQIVQVDRQGVTPGVRSIPISTAATILPMTLEQVGHEVQVDDLEAKLEDEEKMNELLVKVDSLEQAFKKFAPKASIRGMARGTEFRVDLEFKTLRDFEPENIEKRKDGHNDLARTRATLDRLYRLNERWANPAVARAWAKPELRQEIIKAFGALRQEIQKVAGEKE